MMPGLEMFSLDGKVALVTGAAGQYGRQITEAIAGAGATTHIASRDMGKLDAFAAELREKGYDIRVLPLDLGKEETIASALGAIEKQSGRLDVLVNNAVLRTAMIGWDHHLADYDQSLHVNASGLFFITNLAAKIMKRQKSGSIINIGSMMGIYESPKSR